MCGKGGSSSGGGGYAAGLPVAQQSFTQASPEAMDIYRSAIGLGKQAVSQPYQRFGTTAQDFVAQLTPEQQQAIGGLGGLAQATQPFAAQGAQMMSQAGNANAAQMAGGYMNPFMQQVVSPVQQALQQQQGQQTNQLKGQQAMSGQFGNVRGAMERALLAGQQQLGMGQALSPLYQTGYGQALGAAQADLGRQLQAGQQLGQAGLGAQQAYLGAGTLGQQTQQAGINALYNQFQQAQMFPYMQAQFFGGLAGGLGPLFGQTTTQTQAQNPFGMFLSDPRAKTGVDRDEPDVVGELYDGQKVHAYKYKDGGPAQIGLMADEVAQQHPDAVGVRPDGLMAVDYARATEDAARMGGAVDRPGDYARGGYAEGGLTSGDIAAIVAAQQSMYGQMPKAQIDIPTEGIRTGAPLTPANFAPEQEKPSGLSSALQAGKSITDLLTKGADLYSWAKGDKTKGPSELATGKHSSGGVAGYAFGGDAPNKDDPWEGLLGGIKASEGLKPAEFGSSGSDMGEGKSRGFLDTASDALGTASKLGGLASGLYSAATTLGPALMAMSDPRMKTGVGRSGYEEGGPARRYTPEDIEAYLRPLAKGESGGEEDPYAALGPMTKSGDRAYGKYQIMGANIPSWSKEAGLGPLTAEEFLANKDAQEKIAQHRFGQYLEQTGAPEEAAAMWFAGPGYKKHMGAKDVLGTSIPEYQARYQRNLEGGLGDALDKMGPRERSFQASANLPGEGGTVDLKGGVKPSEEEGFGLNRQTIIPALAGLGAAIEGMTSSPSRYLGTALLRGAGAGLGAGAKSYMETGLQIPEIAKREQEVGKTAAETEERRQLAKRVEAETKEKLTTLYEKQWVPNVGWMVYDKTQPYKTPIQISDAAGNPVRNVDPATIKTRTGGEKKEAPTAPPSEEKMPTDQKQVGSSLDWQPTLEAPKGTQIPGALNIAMSGDLPKQQAAAQAEIERQRQKATSAYDQQYRLDEMERQFRNLPERGVLQAGPYSGMRTNFAKGINEVVTMLGGKPLFDPSQTGAAENLAKDTTRLGFDVSKALGHEPGFIVQSAVAANPGMENTPVAFERITAGLKEATKYEQDKLAFLEDYSARFGTIVGADKLFRKLNPPEAYAKRAVLSTIDPADMEYIRTHDRATLEKNSHVIDKKYGQGVTDLLLGK